MHPDRLMAAWQEQFDPERAGIYAEQLERLVKQQANLGTQLERLDEAYVMGQLVGQRYQKQLERVQIEAGATQREIAEAEAKLEGCQEVEALSGNFAFALTYAKDGILALIDKDVPVFLDARKRYTVEQKRQAKCVRHVPDRARNHDANHPSSTCAYRRMME